MPSDPSDHSKADFDEEPAREPKDRAGSSGLEDEPQLDALDPGCNDEAAPFLPLSRLDRLRMRAPQRPYAHPLGGRQTGKEMLVGFEGKDDP